MRIERSSVPAAFFDYVVEWKERMDRVLRRWRRHHNNEGLTSLSAEDYLVGALEVAKELEHPSLVGMVKEELGVLHEAAGAPEDSESELERTIHPLYEAGMANLEQGNWERESEAYNLALRRYRKAQALFNRIHDRTSAAKALVEEARTHIKKGGRS